MKVVLNESQMRSLLSEELSGALYESLIVEGSFDGARRAIRRAVRAGVATAVILSAIAKMNISDQQKVELRDEVKIEVASKPSKPKEMHPDTLAKKVDELNACLSKYIAPHGFELSDIKFSPEHLVQTCYRTGFDLPLLLSQMQWESNFGLKGKRCAQTNSPLSVGLYDNGKNVFHYANQDEAIDSYIRLMQNDYLVNGKTVDDLLKPGGFVNKNGSRYAKDPDYERKIKSTRNSIIRNFPGLSF